MELQGQWTAARSCPSGHAEQAARRDPARQQRAVHVPQGVERRGDQVHVARQELRQLGVWRLWCEREAALDQALMRSPCAPENSVSYLDRRVDVGSVTGQCRRAGAPRRGRARRGAGLG